MKVFEQLPDISSRENLWVLVSLVGGGLAIIIALTVFISSSSDEEEQVYTAANNNTGEPVFLSGEPDSSRFSVFPELEEDLNNDFYDSNYDWEPPPPDDLFEERQASESYSLVPSQEDLNRNNSGQGRVNTNQPRQKTPEQIQAELELRLYQEALTSGFSAEAQEENMGGLDSPGQYSDPYEEDIERYRRQANDMASGNPYNTGFGRNPYEQQEAGQGFNRDRHQQISGQFQEPASAYTLLEGTLIPATLQTGISSSLPGNIVGFISRDVYDSINLQYLLIPKGSRLIGSYDERVVLSQKKLLMSWSRIIFPDGRSLRLPDLNTHDLQGRSGLSGKVNTHFWSIFGQSAMLSLIGASTSLAFPENQGGYGQTQSPGQIVSTQIANEFNQVSTQVLQRNLQRSPTIEIAAGSRFNIFLAGDISFHEPFEYKAPRR